MFVRLESLEKVGLNKVLCLRLSGDDHETLLSLVASRSAVTPILCTTSRGRFSRAAVGVQQQPEEDGCKGRSGEEAVSSWSSTDIVGHAPGMYGEEALRRQRRGAMEMEGGLRQAYIINAVNRPN